MAGTVTSSSSPRRPAPAARESAACHSFSSKAIGPGFTKGKPLKKIGLRGQDTCELFFEDVRVPQSSLLGFEEGARLQAVDAGGWAFERPHGGHPVRGSGALGAGAHPRVHPRAQRSSVNRSRTSRTRASSSPR